jgi:hypothetical protein
MARDDFRNVFLQTEGDRVMIKSLIRIGALGAFTLISAAGFAETAPRNDDPNGAAMERKTDQSPAAKKQKGKIQTQTNPKKNGTNQSGDMSGAKKNGQLQ